MKIYRILGSKGNTTVPWQIRDAMDLRASDELTLTRPVYELFS